MTEEHYFSLCEKFLKGDCTEQEIVLLEQHQDELGIYDFRWDSKNMGNQRQMQAQLYARLQKSLSRQKKTVIKLYKWHFAAAVTIFLLSSSIVVYLLKVHTVNEMAAKVQHRSSKHTVGVPGLSNNKAVLTLSNGKQIVLDGHQNGLLNKQSGGFISKRGDQLIIVSRHNRKINTDLLNTVNIPRGGKYNIVLPDGTKVWLNSSSSLAFPDTFSDNDRHVTLIGEGYFEVSKNAEKPFKVNVNNKLVVEVLGTHFNISAYSDENRINTTLLEGLVKVKYKNKETNIKPGQMAVAGNEPGIKLQTADIEAVIAWKNNMFIFNDENIISMMREISRWYDVDVYIKGDMSNINFTGNYSRKKTLSNLIKNLELTEKIGFTIEGRRVTVTRK